MKYLFVKSSIVLGAVFSIIFAVSTAALAETNSVGQVTFPDLTGAVMLTNDKVPNKPDEVYALLPDGKTITVPVTNLTDKQLNQLMVFLNCSKERTKFNADATIGYMVRENGNEFAKFEKECLTTTQLEQLNLNLINILTKSAQELVQNAAEKAYNAGYSYGINNPVAARAQSQPTPSIHCNISPSLGFKGQTDVNCY